MIEDYEGSRTEFMKMLAEHDSPPAYVVRAQRVESVWQNLLADCRKQYQELLEMPRTRLAQIAHLIDHRWETLKAYVSADFAEYLKQLHRNWQPSLRGELLPTTSGTKIRNAIKDLKLSFTRFNHRWEKCVIETNLDHVNYERSQYNDYYLVEKSAALGSDKLAEMGFERLRLVTKDDIMAEIPRLRVPDI